MWICTNSPYHDQFFCTPAWAKFNREMTTIKLYKWKEVTCLECRATAFWVKDGDDLRKTLSDNGKSDKKIKEYVSAMVGSWIAEKASKGETHKEIMGGAIG